MRGRDEDSGGLFSYVICEARVPAGHPHRAILAIEDEAPEVPPPVFERLYPRVGRPSIAPEKLFRALLLQTFYSIRSERQLMEQLFHDLPFHWFGGLSLDAPVWDATAFSKNPDRLVEGEIPARFLAALLSQARVEALCRTSTSRSRAR